MCSFRLVPYFARRKVQIPAVAELLDVPDRLPSMEDEYDDGSGTLDRKEVEDELRIEEIDDLDIEAPVDSDDE